MTITEFRMLLDLNFDDKQKVISEIFPYSGSMFFFVDSTDGYCYLFDEDGNEHNATSVVNLHALMIQRDIRKIIIPNSIKHIYDYAFSSCNNLDTVVIPSSTITIGYNVFFNCINLRQVIFMGKMIEEVKQMTFYPWGIDESMIECKS